jgi:hypothetical protein
MLVVTFVAALIVGNSPVQPESVNLPTIIHEDYSRSVNVAGNILVGLTLGPIDGNADPQLVRIPLRPFSTATKVCIAARTRDGAYWSQSVLTVPGDIATFGVMQPTTPWRFLDQLKGYARNEYAVVARYGRDCDTDPDAPYLPIRYGPTGSQLTAQFNVQRAISSGAYLTSEGRTVAEGRCRQSPPGTRAIEFNLTCTFELGSFAADTHMSTMVLNRREVTGDRSDSFRVQVPG